MSGPKHFWDNLAEELTDGGHACADDADVHLNDRPVATVAVVPYVLRQEVAGDRWMEEDGVDVHVGFLVLANSVSITAR